MESICGNDDKLEFQKVDLSGLGLVEPGTEAWARVQTEVAEALRKYGGFDVIYNDIEAELQNGILQHSIIELFKEEQKYSYAPCLPSSGWLFCAADHGFKGLELNDPQSLDNLQEYAKTIWPQGNEFFCNTICNYAKHMQGLVQKIHRMILMSLDLEDYYDSHIKSVAYSMRVSEYIKGSGDTEAEYFKGVSDNEAKIDLPSHVDSNYVNIIYQHKVEGLEVELPNYEWFRITPFPNSFTVLLGDAFMAWTNGRFFAPNHRVKLGGSKKRYSTIFCSVPHESDDMIETLDELVDDKHPPLYKPFKYYDYLKFRFANEEKEDSLNTYCGVEQVKIAA